jgi:hypothetical protein
MEKGKPNPYFKRKIKQTDGYTICIILPLLERICPRIRLVLSTVLRMPYQLVPLAFPQDKNKITPHNKRDAPHHRNTLMVVVTSPHIPLLCRLVMLLLCLLFPQAMRIPKELIKTLSISSICFPNSSSLLELLMSYG